MSSNPADEYPRIVKTPLASTAIAGWTSRFRRKCIRLPIKGAAAQWSRIFSKHGVHLFAETFYPTLMAVPIAFACAYAVYHCKINVWNRETWNFTSAVVAFVLIQKLKLSFNRWWDARGHLGMAVKCCRSVLILIKPRLLDGHNKAWECADDARRFCMLYYWLMCFQLLGMDPKQKVVMHHLTADEEQRLFHSNRKKNLALTPLTWLSSRLADLATDGVLTQCELQEVLARVDEMVEAFNGTTKIKTTPIPPGMEHLCAVLVNVYVYSSPLQLATGFRGEVLSEAELLATGFDPEACVPKNGYSFLSMAGRTMFGAFWLSLSFFGLFELGNAFADPFGDDESDLGNAMMTMGNGLQADLRTILEHEIPFSRLRIESGRSTYSETPTADAPSKEKPPRSTTAERADRNRSVFGGFASRRVKAHSKSSTRGGDSERQGH